MFSPSAGSPLGTQPFWICLVFPFIPERLPREWKRAALFLRLNYRVVSLPEVSEPPVPPELPPGLWLVSVVPPPGLWLGGVAPLGLWLVSVVPPVAPPGLWLGWLGVMVPPELRLVSVALPPEDVPYP